MRSLRNPCEIAIIGGGIAGLSAATHAARLGRMATLFEAKGFFGGLVATVGEVDGLLVPGQFSGQDLAVHLLELARQAGVQILEFAVASIELNPKLGVTDCSNKVYHPEAIVIASGASLRKLSVPGEERWIGKGVSRCATCDGVFFRDQDVVVVGGGDSAAQEALVLAKTSRRVTLVCRSPLRAKRDYVERLAARENVSFIWDSEVSLILGSAAVEGVRLRNLKDGGDHDLECTGVFPFIGTLPNTQFLPRSLLTISGHVNTCRGLGTSDSRVFAAGGVRAEFGGNLVQAMADGVGAAESAARLLSSQ